MGGCNSTHAHSNYLVCMRCIWINTYALEHPWCYNWFSLIGGIGSKFCGCPASSASVQVELLQCHWFSHNYMVLLQELYCVIKLKKRKCVDLGVLHLHVLRYICFCFFSVASQLASTRMKRLSVTNFSSENNLPTFRLNAPVVIRVKVKRCE